VNLAPYSFFNCFNYRPPIIGFSSIGFKDTVRNCSETREFTWNLATRSLAEAVNTCSDPVEPEVSEFELAGVSQAESNLVAPPRVEESPVNFECKVTQIVQLTNADSDSLETWLVLGEVVAVHIEQQLVKDGVFDTVAAEPILRGGGPADYFGITRGDLFQLHRKFGHREMID
jgi:flavin reductase (DIM6/NTAB) family NADH-FMN oxidoreductase RutF